MPDEAKPLSVEDYLPDDWYPDRSPILRVRLMVAHRNGYKHQCEKLEATIEAQAREIERLRALLEGDCEHGYFQGMGCGICGTPIKRLRARVVMLTEGLDNVRKCSPLDGDRAARIASDVLFAAAKGGE